MLKLSCKDGGGHPTSPAGGGAFRAGPGPSPAKLRLFLSSRPTSR